MIPGDLLSFVAYFRSWADAHPDVSFFLFGSAELGISYARSMPDFDYPAVWLEQPVIESRDNDAAQLNEIYYVGISVLLTAPGDDPQAQTEAYAKALRIVYDLQKKLKQDRKAGLLTFDWNGMKKEAISQLWADNHYGFRLEVPVDFNLNAIL